MGITVAARPHGPAPLAPLTVRGAHASAAGALQAKGGSGAPEAGGEQAERRSEEVFRSQLRTHTGAGALLSVRAVAIRTERADRGGAI